MGADTKRLGTDLSTLLQTHGPRTLRSELAALVEAQGPDGYVMNHALRALLGRYPEQPLTSGYTPVVDRKQAVRLLQALALWARIPEDKEINEAIAVATKLRHPDSDTGDLRSYLRLLEVQQFLGGEL